MKPLIALILVAGTLAAHGPGYRYSSGYYRGYYRNYYPPSGYGYYGGNVILGSAVGSIAGSLIGGAINRSIDRRNAPQQQDDPLYRERLEIERLKLENEKLRIEQENRRIREQQ